MGYAFHFFVRKKEMVTSNVLFSSWQSFDIQVPGFYASHAQILAKMVLASQGFILFLSFRLFFFFSSWRLFMLDVEAREKSKRNILNGFHKFYVTNCPWLQQWSYDCRYFIHLFSFNMASEKATEIQEINLKNLYKHVYKINILFTMS